MSIKLYDGLKVRESSMSLFEVVDTVQEAITPVFIEEQKTLVAEEIAAVVDYRHVLEEYQQQDTNLFFAAKERWDKEQQRHAPNGALHDPLRFTIVFGQLADGTTLAYPYFLKASYMDALLATDIFDKYGYWNNTDRPDDVTEEQWDQRISDWESILRDGRMAHLPQWSLATEHTFVDMIFEKFDLNEYKTPRQRIGNLLMDHAMPDAPGETPMDKLHTVLYAVREYMKTHDPVLPPPLPDKMTDMQDIAPFTPAESDLVIIREMMQR